MASPLVRSVWVRLQAAEEGDEVRVEVQPDGLIEDLMRAALVTLEFPREGVRLNSLRACTEAGDRLSNRHPVATLEPNAVVLLELREPSAPPTRDLQSSPAEDTVAAQPAAAAGAAGASAAARRVAEPGVARDAVRSPALRRMMRELRLAQTDPSWGVSAAPVSGADLFTWHCNVAGHPAGGGSAVTLHMELTFPDDYPTRPPRVEVLGSTVRHPNVFSTFICLDMLEGGEWASDEEKRRPYCGWSSAYSVLAILRQLQTFFFEGDGTKWWDCSLCTLRNPISRRRCDACDQARGRISEVNIDVAHHVGFTCRCGHSHVGEAWPPFPDPLACDDAPAAVPPPEHPDDVCVICLGNFDDVPQSGPLRGALGARPPAQLVAADGSDACKHRFHLPCVRQLAARVCPLCRVPFDHAVVRRCEACDGPSAPSRTTARPEALSHRARDRMAWLAGWPFGVTVRLMSCLRRPERSTLAGALPVWRDALQAPIFWEAQELQCFHEKTGPEEDVIGIGVHAEGRGKLAKLTAHFDAVSLTAWRGGLRRAAWKEPMTHWLPLFVDRVHARRAAPLYRESLALLAECTPSGTDSHLPAPVFESLAASGAPPAAAHAISVLPEMMHQLLKQVLDGDRHASSKVLKGYFVLHRLFLHFCDEWPSIREAADVAVRNFARSPEQRTKTATPWMAYILQLLTISNVGWDEVKEQYIEEVLARSVQFTRASFPDYQPVDPDAETAKPASETADPFSDWLLFEHEHGSELDPGTEKAQALGSGTWLGRPRGWACLVGAPRPASGRSAFSLRLQRLPEDAVCRIGWTSDEEGSPFSGWFCYADGGCFGRGCWRSSSRGSFSPYGEGFREGDLLTACADRGRLSLRRNGRDLGAAFWCPAAAELRPVVAVRRRAQFRLLAPEAAGEGLFSSPEQFRSMAWEARLARRGNTLVLFQAFFLSLVRPRGGAPPRWDALEREYDRRLGFPSPEMSAALMEQFGEVHRVVSLRGSEGWPLFFRMLGCGDVSARDLDRRLFAAYQRATRLGYKMGGRHDHA